MPLVALIVDDSMLIRHTVCRFLEERGFSVESASNGQEALEALERMNPDLIITDMQMPKMDGGELIDALKSHPKTATIPVIVLAGKRSGVEKAEKSRRLRDLQGYRHRRTARQGAASDAGRADRRRKRRGREVEN